MEVHPFRKSKRFNFEKQILLIPVLSYVPSAYFAQLVRLAAARAPRASVGGLQTVDRETLPRSPPSRRLHASSPSAMRAGTDPPAPLASSAGAEQ